MKTTILSIAAAAAITLGTAGAASAAGPVAKPGLFEGGAAKVQTVDYRYGGLRRRSVDDYGNGYGNGHGQDFAHRLRCRRLYYRGYVLGDPFARRLFNRFCTYRFGYRYGGRAY